MQLNVLPSVDAGPWYGGGLRFTCTQCGNCCTGGPGYVWISRDEIVRLSQYLKLAPEETVERYCRKIGERFSLKEVRGRGGSWDCIFLKDEESAAAPGEISHTKRVCAIYAARPHQCRAWPFWESNLQSEEAWNRAARNCYGMNSGQLHTREQIDAMR